MQYERSSHPPPESPPRILRRHRRAHQAPYWRQRLEGRHYDAIQFRNGYATNAPEMRVEFRGLRRYGRGRSAYYAIRLGRILQIKRWRAPKSH